MKKVIDVSYAQGNIDFKKVKNAGIDGVIIRAGYGKGNADDYFTHNITNAIKNKLHIGIYWFSYAYTVDMARREAKYCNDLIQKYKLNLDMPVFFDWEYDSMRYANNNGVYPDKSLITNMNKAFCEEITKLGYVAGYYLNEDYRKNYIDESKLTEYKRWFSYPGEDYKNCYLFQYTFDGEINGISGTVDMDYLYGSYTNESKTTVKKKKKYSGSFPIVPPILRNGSQGTQVMRLQKFLNWYGKYGLDVDGIFGAKTERAVKDFQQDVFPSKPAEWDGEVGERTLKQMKKVKK